MARRIAVVNDEQDFVDMVSILLMEEGYEVRACSNGEAALPLIGEWHPHLVLLDIRMAGLSGWQTLELLQENPATRGVRVLITSGAVEEVGEARARLHEQGHDFIALPFDLEDFVRKIKQMAGEPWQQD